MFVTGESVDLATKSDHQEDNETNPDKENDRAKPVWC